MKDAVIAKYSEDDILEIMTEYLAKEHGYGEFCAEAKILGTPGHDLRLVAVIGDPEDRSIQHLKIEEVDEKSQYNGSHSKATYTDPKSFSKRIITDC